MSIAPRFRVPAAVMLAAFDLLGVAVAVHVFPPSAAMFQSVVAGAAVVLLGGNICGLYTVETLGDLQRSARGTIALGVGLLPGASAAAFFVGGRLAAWHMALGVACGVATALFGRLACGLAIQRYAERVAEQVLIVGTCRSAERLLRSASVLNGTMKIAGQIVVGDGEPGVPLVGRIHAGDSGSDMISGISYPERGVDRVVILKADLDDGQFIDIIRRLEALSVPIHVLTGLPGSNRFSTSSLADEAEWIVRRPPLKPGVRLAKRALDLLLSGLLLVVLAPLMVLIGLLIRLETPGPALFRQVRLGRENRSFTVFKFRTMRADTYGTDGSIQAVRGDSRVTRIGAILRKTSLDEFPQLLNVLNGTMSLVGPRPHPTELNRRFVPLIEGYSARHRVAPGITGWAQVNGFRGETSTVEQMQARVDHDLEYIRHHSIVFDFWILLRTVAAVIANRNAY